MTLAQRRNRLTTHFSERIPVVKRSVSVSKYTLKKQDGSTWSGIIWLRIRRKRYWIFGFHKIRVNLNQLRNCSRLRLRNLSTGQSGCGEQQKSFKPLLPRCRVHCVSAPVVHNTGQYRRYRGPQRTACRLKSQVKTCNLQCLHCLHVSLWSTTPPTNTADNTPKFHLLFLMGVSLGIPRCLRRQTEGI